MSTLTYSIDDDVFVQFPEYTRGVVLAFNVTNAESPNDLVVLLREAEESLRARLKKEEITAHPNIISWRDAFRAFGAKPAKFRPSIEAMARRILNGNALPSINALVDIGNVISLRHIVPVGGHAIDVMKQGIILRKATGMEEFVPFGSEQVEHPEPGEIIFTEGNTVLTRRWSWRQANHTLTLPTTTAIEFNIDGLPPVIKAKVEDICKETMDLVNRFCGGKIRFEILSKEHPSMELVEKGTG
jgi:DNA/RNA-binding domain of Phe-tRNA-synthetase-like protein